MLESYLRPAYQKYLVDPLAMRLNVPPVWITLLAVIVGICAGLSLLLQHAVLAVLLLAGSGYLDSLDGTVARTHHTQSNAGAVLDIVADRVVEFAVIFALYLIDPTTRGVAAMMMLGSTLICITSFLVIGIFVENNSQKSFHYSVGLMERAEAFIFFGVMMLLPQLFIPLAWIYTSLVFYTAGLRLYQFVQSQG